MKSSALIFFIFLFTIIKSKAQDYNYLHYDVKDGLSGNTVYKIVQDKDGFIWFGTETGLSRFDGTHFKNFTVNDSLPGNEIISLFVDSKNRIWIFPFKNSICYYYQGKIYSETNDTTLKKFHLQSEIYKACEDHEGNIIFLETHMLHILSKEDKVIEIKKINGENFQTQGCGKSEAGICNLFISFPKDEGESKMRRYSLKNLNFFDPEIINIDYVNRNAVESNPSYSILKSSEVFKILDNNSTALFSIPIPIYFHTISYLNDSSFTISTLEKTFLVNINQKRIVDTFLSHKGSVNSCFEDSDGNIWFATMSQGIYRLSSTKFINYFFSNNYISSPAFAINRFQNDLFVAVSGSSLWHLNIKTNTIKQEALPSYNLFKISSILPLSKTHFLLATDDGVFDLNNKKISNYYHGLSIKNFFLHDDSVLVISDRLIYDLKPGDFEHIDTIWKSRATCACKFNTNYYIGTLSGLFVIDKNSTNTAIATPLLKKKITAIVASKNSIWVATDYGVYCITNNKIAYHLTEKDGLTSNFCRCLYFSNTSLWVGTDKGICKINISLYPFDITHFTTAEGLNSEIINCIYAENDSVFAGTPFGLSFFDATKIQNKSICRLKLTDIRSKNSDWYYRQDSIQLLNNDNFLKFEYTGISFISSDDITFYYQLKGLDSSWQSTKQNSVEFQALPAGGYQFNIYAKNKYGAKSKMLSVFFTKEKTFWELLWVRIFLVIFSIFLIWLIINIRIKTIRKKANERLIREIKIHDLEQMALRAQMNPHFIFNCLNSIQQYVFTGNTIEANQFITNFSSLIRQTLYISGKKFIPLDEEIKYLDTYLNLEQTKYEKIFDFHINKNEKILAEDISIPPLLLQPYIENSIRHGVLNIKEYRGKIFIDFIIENNFLICTIEDNGIGRQNAIKLKENTVSNHQSKGMELVQKRIESLNNIYNILITVLIEDLFENNKTGTRVIIKLPLNYE